MAINYEQVGWDSNKYVNPTNMNKMDNGIKAACDKVDAHDQQIETINSNLEDINYKKLSFDEFSNGTASVSVKNISPRCLISIAADYSGSAGGQVFILSGVNGYNFSYNKLIGYNDSKITTSIYNVSGSVCLDVNTSSGFLITVRIIPL